MRSALFLFFYFITLSLFPSTTGKVTGRVYYSRTGKNLPYVNVIIDGTTMNAKSDHNGYFLILNVPPGLYSVTARMIGYKSVTQTNVRVDADFTRTIEFSLESEAIAKKDGIL